MLTLAGGRVRLGVIGVTTELNSDYKHWYHMKADWRSRRWCTTAAAARGWRRRVVASRPPVSAGTTAAHWRTRSGRLSPLIISARTHNLLPEAAVMATSVLRGGATRQRLGALP